MVMVRVEINEIGKKMKTQSLVMWKIIICRLTQDWKQEGRHKLPTTGMRV